MDCIENRKIGARGTQTHRQQGDFISLTIREGDTQADVQTHRYTDRWTDTVRYTDRNVIS
jgi:hypothetical protein